jgi:hypothetical protein
MLVTSTGIRFNYQRASLLFVTLCGRLAAAVAVWLVSAKSKEMSKKFLKLGDGIMKHFGLLSPKTPNCTWFCTPLLLGVGVPKQSDGPTGASAPLILVTLPITLPFLGAV